MSVVRIRRRLFALALAFAVPAGHAQSVGSAFSYQGELRAQTRALLDRSTAREAKADARR